MLSKISLRLEARTQRELFYQSLSEERRGEISEQIQKNFFKSIPLDAQEILSAYWPKGSELDCRPLIHEILRRNFKLALPRMQEGSSILSFHLWKEGDSLQENAYHVLEPLGSAPVVGPTLLLIPLLAFDDRGTRLGCGKGNYDVTLEKIKKFQKVKVVGLAYECQKADFIPREMHDQTLDYVITEFKVYKFKTPL